MLSFGYVLLFPHFIVKRFFVRRFTGPRIHTRLAVCQMDAVWMVTDLFIYRSMPHMNHLWGKVGTGRTGLPALLTNQTASDPTRLGLAQHDDLMLATWLLPGCSRPYAVSCLSGANAGVLHLCMHTTDKANI
jgi:hypothetical protein